MQRTESELMTGHAQADSYMHAPKPKTIEDELAAIKGLGPAVENHKAAPVLGDKSKGLRRFRSDSPKFRLQMKTTPPFVSSKGYHMEGESRFIQFKPYTPGGGVFETEDLEEIEVIEACTGYGVTIYDINAMQVEMEKSRMDFVDEKEEFGAKNGKGNKRGK